MNPIHVGILGDTNTTAIWVAGLVIVVIIILVMLVLVGQFIGLWVRSWASGAHVGLIELMGMRIRKVNTLQIVNSRIQAHRAGLAISTADMESYYLAGGDVQRVVNAMVAARMAGI